MLLIIDKDDFNHNKICFGEKTKNNIMENSYFYNVTYEDILFSIHHLYIKYSLNDIRIDKYFNKYKLNISNNDTNNELKTQLCNMEQNILNLFSNKKTHSLTLRQQLYNNNVKCMSNKVLNNTQYSKIDVIIKISGIWENNNEIGVIYKLIIV